MKTPRRRDVLRSVGVSLSLPLMPSLANDVEKEFAKTQSSSRKRMVCIGNMLGFYPAAFWPEASKRDEGKDSEARRQASLLTREEYDLGLLSLVVFYNSLVTRGIFGFYFGGLP